MVTGRREWFGFEVVRVRTLGRGSVEHRGRKTGGIFFLDTVYTL